MARLKARLSARTAAPGGGERATLVQRVQAIAPPPAEPGERIEVIRASVGNTVRVSLRELMVRIDSADFIQGHRSAMAGAGATLSATRGENGHYSLALRGADRSIGDGDRCRMPARRRSPAAVARTNRARQYAHRVAASAGGPAPRRRHRDPTMNRLLLTALSLASLAGSDLIEGMKFSMTGWREIQFAIDGPAGSDRVTFNTVVAEPDRGR